MPITTGGLKAPPNPLIGALGLLLSACHTPARPVPSSEPSAPAVPAARLVSSNVERRDYAGSAACAPCHSEIYDKWRASPMRRMTRPGTGDTIRAPFDGSTFHFKGDQVTFEAREGRRYMRVQSEASGAQLFRVTRVIGGRYREDFTGVEVQSTDAASLTVRPVAGDPTAEPVLPVSYLLFAGQWRYKGYSVMVKERPRLGKHGAPWRQTCIFCHNTEPYLATIYDDLLGGGRTYQGSVSDRLLPEDRLWKTEATDPPALARALGDELAFLGARPLPASATAREALDATVRATWDRFGEAQLVEVGIGCEACHNGAREHTRDPGGAALVRAAEPLPPRGGPGPHPEPRGAAEPHLRALPHGALLALPVHLGRRAPQQPGPRRQHRQLGRGARFPARRLHRHPPLHRLPRPSHRGPPRRPGPPRHGGRQPRVLGLPHPVRRPGRARRAHAPRAGRRRQRLPGLPHAPQERRAHLRADALPPHREAHRRRPGRERPPPRVRALPRRQVRRRAHRVDGDVVEQALRPRRPAGALRRRSRR